MERIYRRTSRPKGANLGGHTFSTLQSIAYDPRRSMLNGGQMIGRRSGVLFLAFNVMFFLCFGRTDRHAAIRCLNAHVQHRSSQSTSSAARRYHERLDMDARCEFLYSIAISDTGGTTMQE